MLHEAGSYGIARRFRRLDNMLGWFAFLIAAMTYCVTAEPSASYWDCSEFITSAHNLEVTHPPGAPFFMLAGNFFSMFAAPDQVAYCVNILSALLSAGCILFLFWSITHLVRRLIIGKSGVMTDAQAVIILASGMVGALAYTWSDTFWFSAVEAEVYSSSSLLTAVTFWVILKWEESDGSPAGDRWLILIAYLTGLSIGVHILNLLCIPAVVLVIYYKRYPMANWKGSFLALFLSFALVAMVLYGIVPGMLKMAGWFELLFVNVFGAPFHVGLILYLLLLFAILVAGVVATVKGLGKNSVVAIFTFAFALLGIPFYGHEVLVSVVVGVIMLVAVFFAAKRFIASLRAFNTIFLCAIMIVVGYSSYAVVVIRSIANTPMEQVNADNIFSLASYINREQYGSRPLLYGPGFDSELKVDEETGDYMYKKTNPIYKRVGDRYELAGYGWEYLYEQNMLFPRMYSSSHADSYEAWIGGEVTNTVKAKHPENRSGKKNPEEVKVPTQWDNAKFFMFYQIGYMYMRYFAWNFIGRQNDVQFLGGLEHGNCITGIPVIDDLAYGDQDMLPSNLKENEGRNLYYGIPLVLGIFGLIWQYRIGRTGRQQFWVVFTLFFMTGLAIVLYLNQTPSQPRDRDYSFAASFYAFAIWIGMGVAGIMHFIGNRLKEADEKKRFVVSCVVGSLCLLVPLQMLSQTWDDHDRSGRYACRDFSKNILNSMSDEGCPIVFTSYDNDTYPLWYCQGVEGVRTDARVCFAAFTWNSDYLDQLKSPAYESPAIAITWDRDYYRNHREGNITVLPKETTPVIMEYFAKEPEARRLLGKDPFDVKSVARYWIQESVSKEKSAERVVVDKLLDYVKKRGPKVYSDSISIWRSSAYVIKKRLEKCSEEERVVLSDSIGYFESKCDKAKEAIGRMRNIGVKCMPAELHIPVDSVAFYESGMMIPENAPLPEYMRIDFSGKKSFEQYKMVHIDMIANAEWKRPVFMSYTILNSDFYTYLKRFFVIEGMALRVTPFDWSKYGYDIDEINKGDYPVDIDKTYNNVMTRFVWGGIKEKENYYADEVTREFATYHHQVFAKLADAMYKKIVKDGDEGRDYSELLRKLVALLEKQHVELPADKIPLNINDRKEIVAEICKELYIRESAKKGAGGYVGDDVCDRLSRLYIQNLKELLKYSWEYVEWYKVSKYKYGSSEDNSKKLLYKMLRMYYDGRTRGLEVDDVFPVSNARLVEILESEILSMLDSDDHDMRIASLNSGLPQAVARLMTSAVHDPAFAGVARRHVEKLLDMHYEMLGELYKAANEPKADANETKKTLRSMNRVVECLEHEISVATTLGITLEEDVMDLYNESVALCGYRQVYP